MDSVHRISQARILVWVAISFSRGSSQPRDRTQISCIASGYFISWASREAPRAEVTDAWKHKDRMQMARPLALLSLSNSRWGLFACSDSRANPSSYWLPEWSLAFPGPTREAPWVPHHNLRISSQLEKNHEVSPSSQDGALSSCSVSRETPHSLLKFETVLDTLDATQKVPRHTILTREEHRVSRQNLFWAPSPLLISTWGSIPSFVWKGIPTFP